MSISISGGTKVAKAGEAVKVTVGTTATVGGKNYPNAIAIQFTGTECHVIQVFIRTKIVDGKASTTVYGKDRGGLNTIEFTDPASNPDWQVDTTSAAVPYYDFGYAGEMSGKNFTMVDAPTMTGAKYDLPGAGDVTTFDAYAFCISDKDIVGIVKWDLAKKGPTLATPTASLLDGDDWWNELYKGRSILTTKGYTADLYLPTKCMK